MNTPKWIPKLNNEIVKLFDQTRNLERDFRVLGKKFTTDINMDLPDFYVSSFGMCPFFVFNLLINVTSSLFFNSNLFNY